MGVDLLTSRRTYNVRCYWYKKNTSVDSILTRTAKPESIFYAKDIQDFQYTAGNAGGLMKFESLSGMIETQDDVSIKESDFVYYGGKLYIVVQVVESDQNRMKYYSNRPTIIRKIMLRK
jgi:hypothetical protein